MSFLNTKKWVCDRCNRGEKPATLGGRPKGWERVLLQFEGGRSYPFDLCAACIGTNPALKVRHANKKAVLTWALTNTKSLEKAIVTEVVERLARGMKRLYVEGKKLGRKIVGSLSKRSELQKADSAAVKKAS